MERQVFDRMAELDQQHWWYRARRDILEETIRRIVRPPADARILEIGCGTGHNLEMLGRFGSLDAIELDDEARALASRRLGKPVHAGALPGVAAELNGPYDLIALLDVLEHIEDDEGALNAIRDLLKPGGKLLLTVPANPWMWTAHDAIHHHFRRYRRAEIPALAARAKLAVDFLSPFNTLLFPLIAGVRAMGKLTGKEDADDRLPSPLVNAALGRVFGAERSLLGRVPFPFGVSLIGVLRRPD